MRIRSLSRLIISLRFVEMNPAESEVARARPWRSAMRITVRTDTPAMRESSEYGWFP